MPDTREFTKDLLLAEFANVRADIKNPETIERFSILVRENASVGKLINSDNQIRNELIQTLNLALPVLINLLEEIIQNYTAEVDENEKFRIRKSLNYLAGDIQDILFMNNCSIDPNHAIILLNATRNFRLPIDQSPLIKALLEDEKFDKNSPINSQGETLLERATLLGDINLVMNLLERGAPINFDIRQKINDVDNFLIALEDIDAQLKRNLLFHPEQIINFIADQQVYIPEVETILPKLRLSLARNEPIKKIVDTAIKAMRQIQADNAAITRLLSHPLFDNDQFIFLMVDKNKPEEGVLKISVKDLAHKNRIGSGHYGEVFRCEYKGTDEKIKKALDPFNKGYYWIAIKNPLGVQDDFIKEAKTINELREFALTHPELGERPYNLGQAAYLSSNTDTMYNYPVIVSKLEAYEFTNKPISSDLINFVRKATALQNSNPDTQDPFNMHFSIHITNLLLQIYRSMEAMHTAGWLHLDFASRNVFLTETDTKDGIPIAYNAVLADYGKSLKMDGAGIVLEDTVELPFAQLNAERINRHPLGITSDFHSFRTLIIEILAARCLCEPSLFLRAPNDHGTQRNNDQLISYIRDNGNDLALIAFVNNVKAQVETLANPQIKAEVNHILNTFVPYLCNSYTITQPEPKLNLEAKNYDRSNLFKSCISSYVLSIDQLLLKLTDKPLEADITEFLIALNSISQSIRTAQLNESDFNSPAEKSFYQLLNSQEITQSSLKNINAKEAFQVIENARGIVKNWHTEHLDREIVNELGILEKNATHLQNTYQLLRDRAIAAVANHKANSFSLNAKDLKFYDKAQLETLLAQFEQSIKGLKAKLPADQTILIPHAQNLQNIITEIEKEKELIWNPVEKLKNAFVQQLAHKLNLDFAKNLQAYDDLITQINSPNFNRIAFGRALGLINQLQQIHIDLQTIGKSSASINNAIDKIEADKEDVWLNIGEKNKYQPIWDEFKTNDQMSSLERDIKYKGILPKVLQTTTPELPPAVQFARQVQSVAKIKDLDRNHFIVSSNESLESIKNKMAALTAARKPIDDLFQSYELNQRNGAQLDIKTILGIAASYGEEITPQMQEGAAHFLKTKKELDRLKENLQRQINKRPMEDKALSMTPVLEILEKDIKEGESTHNHLLGYINSKQNRDIILSNDKLTTQFSRIYQESVDQTVYSLITLNKDLFAQLDAEEISNKADGKPILTALAKQSTDITFAVINDIVKSTNLHVRTLIYEYWINVAYRTLYNPELSSPNVAAAIFVAFSNPALARLQLTQSAISQDALDKYKHLEEFVSSADNFKALRNYLNTHPDAIPPAFIYEKDHISTFEAKGPYSIDIYRNKRALQQRVNAIRAVRLDFAPNKSVLSLIKNPYPDFDTAERELFNLSQKNEPKLNKGAIPEKLRTEIKENTIAKELAGAITTTKLESHEEQNVIYRSTDAKPTNLNFLVLLDETNIEFKNVLGHFDNFILAAENKDDLSINDLKGVKYSLDKTEAQKIINDNAGKFTGPLAAISKTAVLEHLVDRYNSVNPENSLPYENALSWDLYAKDLFQNQPHHLLQTKNLLAAPAFHKALALIYLISHQQGIFFKPDNYSPKEKEKVNLKFALAQEFINELSNEEFGIFTRVYQTILTTNPSIKTDLPELIGRLDEQIDFKVRKLKARPEFDHYPTKLELSEHLSHDMNMYSWVKPKPGGANKPGEFGGEYQCEYIAPPKNNLIGSRETFKQRVLFKQDVNKDGSINFDKVIAEFVTGRIMNTLAGDLTSSTILATAPTKDQKPMRIPDDTGKNVYVGSIYYDNFKEIFKVMGYNKRIPFFEFLHKGPLRRALKALITNSAAQLRFSRLGIAGIATGDFDLNSANVGDSNGLVKIDHGAGLEALENKIHPHSRLRHLPLGKPTNHLHDFPRKLKINPIFAEELLRQSKIDLTQTIDAAIDEIGRFYGPKPMAEFAKRMGMDTQLIMRQLNVKGLDETAKAHIKTQLIADIKAFLKYKMKARQKSLEEFGLEIKLSLCFKQTKSGFTPEPVRYIDGDSIEKTFDLNSLILENPVYFLKGSYHFRKEDQAHAFGELRIKAFKHKALAKLTNDAVDAQLDTLLKRAVQTTNPEIIEAILANEELMKRIVEKGLLDSLKDMQHEIIDNIAKGLSSVSAQLLQPAPVMASLNNADGNLTNLVISEVLAAEAIEARTLIVERWIGVMKKSLELGDFPNLFSIFRALHTPELGSLANTLNGLSPNAQAALHDITSRFGTQAFAVDHVQQAVNLVHTNAKPLENTGDSSFISTDVLTHPYIAPNHKFAALELVADDKKEKPSQLLTKAEEMKDFMVTPDAPPIVEIEAGAEEAAPRVQDAALLTPLEAGIFGYIDTMLHTIDEAQNIAHRLNRLQQTITERERNTHKAFKSFSGTLFHEKPEVEAANHDNDLSLPPPEIK